MPPTFDHEKLIVYQRSIEFVAWVDPFLEGIIKAMSAHNQLDRASTSISLNIAEGNGKWQKPDRARFFDIARGSAVECAAALDVFVARKLKSEFDITEGKRFLFEIVQMLMGLIKRNRPDWEMGADGVREDVTEYIVGGEGA